MAKTTAQLDTFLLQLAEMEFCHIICDDDTDEVYCGQSCTSENCSSFYDGEAICDSCGCPTCPVCALMADLEDRFYDD